MSAEEVTTTEVMRVEEKPNMSIALTEAEARAKLMKNLLPHLVQVCYASNILSMRDKDGGSKPYINNDGCQKIARIAGISFGKPNVVVSYEDMPAEPAEYYSDSGNLKKEAKQARRAYIVEVEGEASLLGQTITEFGGASSEDGFYNRPKESPVEIRLEVRKKAMANWQGRCVRTLLGLQGLSWKDLTDVGFKDGEGGAVEFENGKHAARKSTAADEGAASEVKTKLREMVLNEVQGNKTAAEDLLELMTEFEGKDGMVKGKRNIAYLSDKAANTTWNKYKHGGKERDKYYEFLREVHEKHGIGIDEPPEGKGVTL